MNDYLRIVETLQRAGFEIEARESFINVSSAIPIKHKTITALLPRIPNSKLLQISAHTISIDTNYSEQDALEADIMHFKQRYYSAYAKSERRHARAAAQRKQQP